MPTPLPAASDTLPALSCGAVPFALGAELPEGWSFGSVSWTATSPPADWAGQPATAPRPSAFPVIVARLPRGARSVVIEPRAGTSVVGLNLRDGRGRHPVALSCASLIGGWWQIDTGAGGRPRWTAGAARLRLPPSEGPAVLEVALAEGHPPGGAVG